MLSRKRKSVVPVSNEHTLIAKGSTITGDIQFGGVLHIQGNVIGHVTVAGEKGQLVIDRSGIVEGEVRVPHIIINGQVIGDVHATEKLELAENAKVEGNVTYETIEMMAGAQVNGKLIRNKEEQKPQPLAEKPNLKKNDVVADKLAAAKAEKA